LSAAFGTWAQGKAIVEFTAKGCCPMCEDRIIEALDVPGVRVAEWNQFEEKATVVYKPKKITQERIEQLVAEAGHDTEHVMASDEAYGALAKCCLYRDGCPGCSDHEGHDHKGHDHEGHDHEGHDHEGHDHEGHDDEH